MITSIDIGTNSVLLLICRINSGVIDILHEEQALPRLGKGVDKEKNLHPDSCNRVLNVLNDFKEILQAHDPQIVPTTIVTATSAVRDAANRDEFLQMVKKETGWNIRLLSGNEEAETTFCGGLSVLENRNHGGNLIIDIGGGSTEIAFGRGLKLEYGQSIDMGSVRFTERFFLNDPPREHEIAAARQEIRKQLSGFQVPKTEFDVIGVAGTVTSIAAIHQKMSEYDTGKLNGVNLTRDQIRTSIKEFSVMAYKKIEEKYPPFLTGRGEVILAGTLIIDEILEYFDKQFVIVSTGGIRHGILLKEHNT